MNKKYIAGLVGTLFLSLTLAAEPVKMSKSGICHAPGSTYYTQTKHFTPYPTLKDCLNAGGRMPKK
jgi:hypothetical protein